VILILIALQLPAAGTTRGQGQVASCIYNHHQLARAWQSYAQDNDGRLVGNLDGGNISTLSNSNKTWVLGWLDFNGGTSFGAPGGASDTNTLLLTQFSPLAPYLGGSADVFKCPADSSLSRGRTGSPRVRSVSMNGYIGERAAPYTSGYRLFKKLSEFTDPTPAQAFVFTDEREDSINDGWFIIDMTGFSPQNPTAYTIVDYPADWHNRGDNLSFADGHTETWRWKDSRTMPAHGVGTQLQLGRVSPNNPDIARLQSAASRKVTAFP
jgi:hypothetical protein